MKLHRATLKRTCPLLVISNGSERGDFAPPSRIFERTGRLHDGVQLLKTYYPHAEGWSTTGRISERTRRTGVSFAWDYEYEDYAPFDLLESSSRMRAEIEALKAFGGDLHLTLTMDLSLDDEEIERVVRSLRRYGRVFLRINHECNGDWFRFNKYRRYREVSDFFVRCHRIVKGVSSTIHTVFGLSADYFVNDGVVVDQFLHLSQEEMGEALHAADYWSIDKYASLHWGWPFEQQVDEGTRKFFRGSVDEWWRLLEETYLKMIWHNRLQAKPLFVNEFNADADVDGADGQAGVVARVYDRIRRAELHWLAGIVLYQYQDWGGLGLEVGREGPAREQPALQAYRDAIGKWRYEAVVEAQPWHASDFAFSWWDVDHVQGLAVQELQGRRRLHNDWSFPLFVLQDYAWGRPQRWARLEPGAALDLAGLDELLILAPPFRDASGAIRHATEVHAVHPSLERMLR